MSNILLERINQFPGDLVQTCNINRTYFDKDEPWSGILIATEFAFLSTGNRLKYYSPGQLVVSISPTKIIYL